MLKLPVFPATRLSGFNARAGYLIGQPLKEGIFMARWMLVLRALVDFVFKACVFYAETEAGRRELDDVEAAWEQTVNDEANAGSVSYSQGRSAEAQAVDEAIADEHAAFAGKRW